MSEETTGAPGRTRPLLSLLAALVCAAAVAGLARFAVGTASGQRMDQLILSGAMSHRGTVSDLSLIAVDGVRLPIIAGALVLAALLALLRRRPGLLALLVVLVVGTNLTTQVIKHFVVTRDVLGPDIEVTPNSFPSGHTTMAAAAAIALVLASGRARPLVAILGAVWTAGAGLGTLVLGWHRPSDVVGAIVVVAAWTFLVITIESLSARRRAARTARPAGHGRRRAGGDRPRRTGGSTADLIAAILLALAGAAALVLGVMALNELQLPLVLDDTSQQHAAYTATAALISGGTAWWMTLVLLLRAPEVPRSTAGDRVP